MPDVSLNGIEFTIKGSSDAASSSIARLQSQLDRLGKSLGNVKSVKAASSAMKDIGKSAKSASKPLGVLLSSLKRIAFYRAIRSAIKAVSEAFREGLKNAYEFSKINDGALASALDTVATKSLTMKNQMGAAFGSLIVAVTPILIQIIQIVNAVASAITRLIAILGGKSTWTRAKDVWTEWGEAAGGAGGAAKEALKYLAPFDELNRLPDESGRGGGGGANTPDYSEMFETVSTDVGAGLLDSITEAFTSLGDWFESKDWIDIGTKAFETLKNIFSDTGKMSELVSAFFETLGAAFGAVVGFAWGFLKTAAEDVIKTFKENIVDYDGDGKISFSEFLTAVWKTATSPIKWIDDNIVKPFWRGFTETLFGEAQDPITVDEFMDWVFGHLSDQAIMTWFEEKAVPWIQDGIDEVIDEISIFFTGMDASTLSHWLDNWGELFKGWLADLPAKFKQAGINAINALAEPFTDGINGIIEKLNNSGLASALGIELDPIEFKLIPDIPKEELTKNYDKAKAEIEAQSKQNPSSLSATANINSSKDNLSNKDKTFDTTANWKNNSYEGWFKKWQGGLPWDAKANWMANSYGTNWFQHYKGGLVWDSKANWMNNSYVGWFKGWQGGLPWDAKAEWKFTKDNLTEDQKTIKVTAKYTRAVDALSRDDDDYKAHALGGAYYGGSWHSIPQYARGGRPHGTMFWAGEAGPEVVGHVGGRTEVLNQSQLAATMYASVSAALSGLRFAMAAPAAPDGGMGGSDDALYNAFVRALESADFAVDNTINMDGDTVYRGVVRRNQQRRRQLGYNPMLT